MKVRELLLLHETRTQVLRRLEEYDRLAEEFYDFFARVPKKRDQKRVPGCLVRRVTTFWKRIVRLTRRIRKIRSKWEKDARLVPRDPLRDDKHEGLNYLVAWENVLRALRRWAYDALKWLRLFFLAPNDSQREKKITDRARLAKRLAAGPRIDEFYIPGDTYWKILLLEWYCRSGAEL